jgi:hypothetical protein
MRYRVEWDWLRGADVSFRGYAFPCRMSRIGTRNIHTLSLVVACGWREVARSVGVIVRWQHILRNVSMEARAKRSCSRSGLGRGRGALVARPESWDEDSGPNFVPLTCALFLIFRVNLSQFAAALATRQRVAVVSDLGTLASTASKHTTKDRLAGRFLNDVVCRGRVVKCWHDQTVWRRYTSRVVL